MSDILQPAISSDDSDVGAALRAELVENLARVSIPLPGQIRERLVPPGWQLNREDHERLLSRPRRVRGTVKVLSAGGFIAALSQRWPQPTQGVLLIPESIEGDPAVDEMTEALKAQITDGGPSPIVPIVLRGNPEDFKEIKLGTSVAIYADEENARLVAVVNDDQGATAGWRDHRIELVLRHTPEWQHWTSHQGMLSQTEFAQAIEDGLDEISSPPAADMLRIAEKFEANINVRFKRGENLRNGATQLVYEEEVDATAGGSVEIPDRFTLRIQPFLGGPRYELHARLRTRVHNGNLTIGYTLERPHLVEAAAFKDVAKEVADEFGITIVEGVAPDPRV